MTLQVGDHVRVSRSGECRLCEMWEAIAAQLADEDGRDRSPNGCMGRVVSILDPATDPPPACAHVYQVRGENRDGGVFLFVFAEAELERQPMLDDLLVDGGEA
jgi:hypothetical protein